jgi:hypothetical protein
LPFTPGWPLQASQGQLRNTWMAQGEREMQIK